jgi:hypothetical protein
MELPKEKLDEDGSPGASREGLMRCVSALGLSGSDGARDLTGYRVSTVSCPDRAHRGYHEGHVGLLRPVSFCFKVQLSIVVERTTSGPRESNHDLLLRSFSMSGRRCLRRTRRYQAVLVPLSPVRGCVSSWIPVP